VKEYTGRRLLGDVLRIRSAVPRDTPLILSLVRELAEYEGEPQAVSAREEDFQRDGFGANPKFRVAIAESDGEPAGMAFFFSHYSTWRGREGIFVEDLIVRPKFRGKGVGKALMAHLARTAIAEGSYGMRWEVLDWNESAVKFYTGIGGRFREHGRTMQLAGDDLKRLAGSE
jgi:GNAT superfamily N-acetyltransferase